MRSLTCILLILLPAISLAGNVQFTLELSAKSITTNDYLRVEYLVRNSRKVSQFLPPAFAGFRVIEGPEQTTGYNMENGSIQEYVRFSFLLQPEQEGKFIIPAGVVTVDGRTYRSNEVQVMVSRALMPGVPEDEAMRGEILLRKEETVDSKIRGNIFVKVEVDRKQVYVGEPVVASYKLYTRLRSESRVVRRPSFTGFSVFDMASPENGESTRENYMGRDYNVYLLRKVQLYPLQSGLLELESAEVENDISFVKADMMGGDFRSAEILRDLSEGSNNSGAVVRQKLLLRSEPVGVNVKALPVAEETVQTGAVGRFSIRSFMEDPRIRRSDVAELHIQVAGKGNFPMILPPVVDWPDGIEVYEPVTAVNYNRFVSPLSGSKLFTFPFSVKKEGSVVIPPVLFSYFDPEKGTYVTTRTGPLRLEVLPALNKPAAAGRPLQGGTSGAWKYMLTLLGMACAFAGIYLLVRRASGQAAPDAGQSPGELTSNPAPGNQEALEPLRKAYAQADAQSFYRLLSDALSGHLAHRYQVEGKTGWEHALAQQGLGEDQVRDIRQLRAHAEMALYTPLGMEGKMEEDLARIERIMG